MISVDLAVKYVFISLFQIYSPLLSCSYIHTRTRTRTLTGTLHHVQYCVWPHPHPYHKVWEYFVYRDDHGLGSMAIHLAHHCFSFNIQWIRNLTTSRDSAHQITQLTEKAWKFVHGKGVK